MPKDLVIQSRFTKVMGIVTDNTKSLSERYEELSDYMKLKQAEDTIEEIK